MIPDKPLRERLKEAIQLAHEISDADAIARYGPYVEAVLLALEDTSLTKTADSLEPTFTLRAQDKLAAPLVRLWADLAEEHGCSYEKVSEAILCAQHMQGWRTRKWPD